MDFLRSMRSRTQRGNSFTVAPNHCDKLDPSAFRVHESIRDGFMPSEGYWLRNRPVGTQETQLHTSRARAMGYTGGQTADGFDPARPLPFERAIRSSNDELELVESLYDVREHAEEDYVTTDRCLLCNRATSTRNAEKRSIPVSRTEVDDSPPSYEQAAAEGSPPSYVTSIITAFDHASHDPKAYKRHILRLATAVTDGTNFQVRISTLFSGVRSTKVAYLMDRNLPECAQIVRTSNPCSTNVQALRSLLDDLYLAVV